MEELDLKDLIGMFWNKRFLILVSVLVFIAIGVIYTLVYKTPMYSAQTTLLLASTKNVSTEVNSTITSTELTINSKLVPTYTELIKSRTVIKNVISNLGLKANAGALERNISVSQYKNTELIQITVKHEDPEWAAKIANEIVEIFAEDVKERYKIDNVQVVDEAEAPTSPSNINHIKDIIIFAFIGIIIAIGYTLIENMLDTTIKSGDEIEKTYSIPVLATIPAIESFNDEIKGGKNK